MIKKLLLIIALLSTLVFFGCSRQEEALTNPTAITYSALIAQTETHGIKSIVGDKKYLVLRESDIKRDYKFFRSILSHIGLVRWDEGFDCNRFASLFISVNQAKFVVTNWHSQHRSLALGYAEVWYRKKDYGLHAIVVAYTERGLIFIEPQTGEELKLDDDEIKSITLCKW